MSHRCQKKKQQSANTDTKEQHISINRECNTFTQRRAKTTESTFTKCYGTCVSNNCPDCFHAALFSRHHANLFAYFFKACPHWQLDRDPTTTLSTLATQSRSVRSTSRGGFDCDWLNPIRNSGRYLHVRYACSRNI